MNFADRFPLFPLFFSFVVYPVFAWMVLGFSPVKHRMRLFACLNVLGLVVLAVLSGAANVRLKFAPQYGRVALAFAMLYVLTVLVNYLFLHLCRREQQPFVLLAFFFPIFVLAYVKYAPATWNPFAPLLAHFGGKPLAAFFVGISYVSFRLTHLVQEVRNEIVEMPDIWEYLAFAFFVPTLSIGPINPYSKFINSLRNPSRAVTPIGRSLLRIVVGFTKYIFLATLINQFTYAGLILDGHPHTRLDLVIAIFAYTLYLYCNFSGFCDIVIGVSGLLGIEVMENFDRPFLSRDFQEFWNRWHITLSLWLRDLMFTPMSKSLIRRFGPRYANHIIAFSIIAVFFCIGIWHGKGLNFALFGVSQGVGLAIVYYYTVFLKKRLGKKGYAAYQSNQWIRAAGVALTFTYFSLTLFLFANNWADIQRIRHAIT